MKTVTLVLTSQNCLKVIPWSISNLYAFVRSLPLGRAPLKSGLRFGADSPPATCQLCRGSQLKNLQGLLPLTPACLDCPLTSILTFPHQMLGMSALARGSESLRKYVMLNESKSYHETVLSIKIHVA